MTRILLVDDVKLFRHLEAAVLEWRGYAIEEASSGAEAMEKIRANPPDLALVDLYMPGMSGLDVCEQVKKDPALRSIPIIIVTSSSRDEDIRKAIRAGCDDYLTKPLEDATLVRKVEELLGTSTKRRFPRVPASMQISFEDFKGIFFEFTRDISRSGVFIEMSDPLPVGKHLKLSFSLPQPFSHPVMAYGRVVRSVLPGEGRPAGMGVSFICLDEQSERIIDALVAAQSDYDARSGVFSRLQLHEPAESGGQEKPPDTEEPRIAALCQERDEFKSSFDELQREHMRLSARLTLIESIHADVAPKPLLAVTLDILGDLLGVAAGGIFLLDTAGDRLIPANARGLPAAVLDHMPLDGPLRQAVEERRLVVPIPPWEVSGATTQVLAATPILRAGQCLGVISVHGLFGQKSALHTHDHQLLEALGCNLGVALANAVARELANDRLGLAQILRTAGFGR